MSDRFVYVSYIRTTPEKLWEALTKPEFTKIYWYGCWQDCSWEVGASWKLIREDGQLADSGEVVECDPPKRLVVTWKNHMFEEGAAEPPSRMSMEIEPADHGVKLTVIHQFENADSFILTKVSGGWPRILYSLKSLLETGEAFVVSK